MSQLREAIRQKSTELWKNQSWILDHDNAPAHTLMLVREFFPLHKTEDTDERKAFSQNCGAVGDTKKRVSEVFEDWKNRWHKCIISEGGYFVGDKDSY